MKSTAERYNRLAEAYIKLSDNFHQLDVAHMTLKRKLVPVIKATKDYQSLTTQLKQDKAELEQTVQALTDRQQRLEEALLMQKANEAELSATIQTLTDEKTTLQGALEAFQIKYDAVADLEALLASAPQAILAEAEQQMELVEETLQEMACNSDPDLSQADKQLLSAYKDEVKDSALTQTVTDDGAVQVLGILPFVA